MLPQKPNPVDLEQFHVDLAAFQETAHRLVDKVSDAAIKRVKSGKPALQQQDTLEQIQHLQAHLNNVVAGSKGDEDSVTEQLLHAGCRSLLVLFAWQQQHGLSSEELFNGKNRP